MKNYKLLTCLGVTALLGALTLPAPAQAPPAYKSVEARLKEQHKRIQQGVASGQLTRREANRLRSRDARIRYAQARDRVTGGHMTRAEHRRLERSLNRASKGIYHQKHDSQTR